MGELTPDLAPQIHETATAGIGEAAQALSRTLDRTIELSVGEPATLDIQSPPEDTDNPGLAILMQAEEATAILLIPNIGGLIPDWCSYPDPTGVSKLQTLAQELSMLLLPEEQIFCDTFNTVVVERLADTFVQGNVENGAGLIPFEIKTDEIETRAWLAWPVGDPMTIVSIADTGVEPQVEEPEPEPQPAEPQQPAAQTAPAKSINETHTVDNIHPYMRSVLRINLPVVVTLAAKRQTLGQIIEIGPGAIIHFDKSCEDMLELEIGGCSIARGEAVKVGDKFGLRITSVILPKERFRPTHIAPTQKIG